MDIDFLQLFIIPLSYCCCTLCHRKIRSPAEEHPYNLSGCDRELAGNCDVALISLGKFSELKGGTSTECM